MRFPSTVTIDLHGQYPCSRGIKSKADDAIKEAEPELPCEEICKL